MVEWVGGGNTLADLVQNINFKLAAWFGIYVHATR
jgi:hypothetical protein